MWDRFGGQERSLVTPPAWDSGQAWIRQGVAPLFPPRVAPWVSVADVGASSPEVWGPLDGRQSVGPPVVVRETRGQGVDSLLSSRG